MDRELVKGIIEFAIENEVESYEFYRDAAEKIKESDLIDIFKDLAQEELNHKSFLEKFLLSEENEMTLREPTDYNISSTLDTPELTTNMSFKDAINIAIKKEEEAMVMYAALSNDVSDEEAKNLFKELEKMEKIHKVKLEKIYLDVAYAEAW